MRPRRAVRACVMRPVPAPAGAHDRPGQGQRGAYAPHAGAGGPPGGAVPPGCAAGHAGPGGHFARPLRALPTPMGADTAVLALNPDLVRFGTAGRSGASGAPRGPQRHAPRPDGGLLQPDPDRCTHHRGGPPLAAPTDRFDGFMAGVSVPLWFVPGARRPRPGPIGRNPHGRRGTTRGCSSWPNIRPCSSRSNATGHCPLVRAGSAAQRRTDPGHLPHGLRGRGDGQAEHLLNPQQANTIFQEHLRTVDSLNGTVLQLERITVTGR